MGLNTDIRIQLESFSDENLRWWINNQRTWIREINIALTNKENQIASASTATDENHNPLPEDILLSIEAGNKPIFHGYPDATEPSDPNYDFGLFERIPDIEVPSNPNPE